MAGTQEVGVIPAPPEGVIDARPTKRFFVRMLVRDIELVPAIVDLIDNSVDGAKRLVAEQPKRRKSKGSRGPRSVKPSYGLDLSGDRIDIRLDGAGFSIEDNCGGIELHRAVGYAFRFGRPDDIEPVEGEVGQFGVGMKRALFKLGQRFEVESVAPKSSFGLSVSVTEWLDDEDNWTFPLDSSAEGEKHPRKALGTKISVAELLPSVASEFGEEDFLQRLRSQIEFSHQAALGAGLGIYLNGHALRSRPPALLSSASVKPRVVSKKVSANGSEVRMSLYAGFVKLQDEGADTDDPDQFSAEFSGGGLAGWYLICNGRMLLFADKTRLTGWGIEVADYHPQYRRFRGYVYLTGNSAAMPWNTAKTAVDEDSPIWRQVRKEIVAALREARTAMNKIKREVQGEGAKESPMTAKLEKAKAVALAELPKSAKLVVPSTGIRRRKSTQRLDFDVPADRFEEVAQSLGLSQPAAIGKRTFDYYYGREIED
jgi:hypothetical protein